MDRRPRYFGLTLVSVVVAVFLCGCTDSEYNVTGDPAFGGTFNKGDRFRLKQDIYLNQLGDYLFVRETEIDSISTISAGTELTIRKVVHKTGINYSRVKLLARISTGEHQGKDIDIHPICLSTGHRNIGGHRVTGPDPAILELVEIK